MICSLCSLTLTIQAAGQNTLYCILLRQTRTQAFFYLTPLSPSFVISETMKRESVPSSPSTESPFPGRSRDRGRETTSTSLWTISSDTERRCCHILFSPVISLYNLHSFLMNEKCNDASRATIRVVGRGICIRRASGIVEIAIFQGK